MRESGTGHGATPDPVRPPVALTIAGSDSGGGAGIQADRQAMTEYGVFGATAITAVTAQHTRGVESSFVLPVAEIDAQIRAVLEDFDVRAVKTGMLATADVVELVADHARSLEAPLVVDPVMVATSGDRLLDVDAETAYERLFEAATLVTPNADEAAVLTGIDVDDVETARRAGETLLEFGVDAALVTGGHLDAADGDDADESDERTVRDLLVTPDRTLTFAHPRIDTDATHGSGCTLSAAITARLALGYGLEAAVDAATDFVERAIRRHYDVGRGPGAVNPAAGRLEVVERR